MTTNSWSAVDSATVPAKLARELRDAWEHFVATSALEQPEGEDRVREAIGASWERSRDAGVDPHGHVLAPSVMEPGETRQYFEQHPLAVAGPLLSQCLRETALESDHLVVVADEHGTLLSIDGNVRVRSRAADMMNFVDGSLWSESGAGTNAIGTALALGHAVQVFAAEHFTEPVQRWTCAAAPVREPDTGKIIGVIDLTGDFTAVHPHSLTAVVATAQAVESFLRVQMHEHDDRMRARHAGRLDPSGVRSALVSRSGRLLAGRPDQWAPEGRIALPADGERFVLPSGAPAVVESTADGEAFVLSRLEEPVARRHRERLELRLLGAKPEARLRGTTVALRPRHAELLVLLCAHPRGTDSEKLSLELYGEAGNPASVRVEMSRLRHLLPGCIDAERYVLSAEPDGDAERVRSALRAGSVRTAAAAYTAPLLARSEAPGVARERDELEGWLRNAVLTSEDAEALWSWACSPSGEEDRVAWSRLLAALAYDDARHSRVVAHLASLRERGAL